MNFIFIALFFTLQCFIQINCSRNFDLDSVLYGANRDANYLNPYEYEPEADDNYDGGDNAEDELFKIFARNIPSGPARDDDELNSLLLDDLYNNYNPYSNEDNADDFLGLDDPRDQESESHSSLVGGYQFVSGGAGEGKQHLKPNGIVENKEEVKSDIDLPAYCAPPNPCPVGYKGEDCDPRPYSEFTADYSKDYQNNQNCMCDTDHNECKNEGINTKKINNIISKMNNIDMEKFSPIVAKKSPRVRRDVESKVANQEQPLYFHVAKKFAKN